MTDQHPITPPPELVDQWVTEAFCQRKSNEVHRLGNDHVLRLV